jgi:hypothetical protein
LRLGYFRQQAGPRLLRCGFRGVVKQSGDQFCATLKGLETQFNTWWVRLQPEWRVSNGKLVRGNIGGSWDSLRFPGQNGLQSVLAALFFWGIALKEKSVERKRWVSAVEDCYLAISSLCRVLVSYIVFGELPIFLDSFTYHASTTQFENSVNSLSGFRLYYLQYMCVCSDFKRGGVRAEFGCFQNGYDIYDIIRSVHLKIHRHPSSSKGPSPNPSNPGVRTLRSLCRIFKKYTYIISTKFPRPKQCATTGCSPNTVMSPIRTLLVTLLTHVYISCPWWPATAHSLGPLLLCSGCIIAARMYPTSLHFGLL